MPILHARANATGKNRHHSQHQRQSLINHSFHVLLLSPQYPLTTDYLQSTLFSNSRLIYGLILSF